MLTERFVPNIIWQSGNFSSNPENPTSLNDTANKLLAQCAQHARRGGWLSSGKYNLTISHDYRFIWFRVAKVATRTILEHFKQSCIPLDVEHAMSAPYPRSLFGEYFKFAFVRHPLARLLSCWRNKVLNENYFAFDDDQLARMTEFSDFVSWVSDQDLDQGDHHLRRQVRLIDLNHIDFLGRMERFECDFRRVCQTLGIPAHHLAQRNASQSLSSKVSITKSIKQQIERLYETDFQVFGYDP